METKKANRRGVYIIGNVEGRSEDFLTKTTTIKSAVSFQFRGKEETKLTLSNIEELQSRLMLLGHAQESAAERVDQEKQYFLKVQRT